MKGKYGTTNILFLNNMISINTQRDGTLALVEESKLHRSSDHIGCEIIFKIDSAAPLVCNKKPAG